MKASVQIDRRRGGCGGESPWCARLALKVSAPLDRFYRPLHAQTGRPHLSLRAAGVLGIIAAWLVLGAPLSAGAATDPTGLWVGNVSVEKVNQPSLAATNLMSVPSPFSFRLLVQVNTNGVRLLQRVLAVWDPAGAIVTNRITGVVTTNGYYVLLSDESQVSSYLQSQPQAKVYRLSSVNFPLLEPRPMVGQFGGTGLLSCSFTVAYNDPVNPFVHRYAPLHDNRRVENNTATQLADGVESYSISRDLTFRFAATDPAHPANPLWGSEEAGGQFEETVYGLYQPIRVQGNFRLRKITTIGTLAY